MIKPMNKKCTCPDCGHEFDPDEQRRKLEKHIEEKLQHGVYDDASYRWMGEYEMYVYYADDTIYTRTLEDRQLPDEWKIATVWAKPEKTIVSLKLDE